MNLCGVQHPDQPGVACDRPGPSTSHSEHSGVVVREMRPEHISWPNPDYVAPPPKKPGSRRATLAALAAQVRSENDPTARLSSDKGMSASAAKTYVADGSRKTRVGQVAQKLIDNVGQWVDASSLATAEVGGFAGTRRMRELREDYGWEIETRRAPDRPAVFQHRLVHLPPPATGD